MRTLKDIPHLEGVRVLVRVDFNVPMQNGKIADDFRVRSALPTIDFLKSRGAKVILMSHLESVDGSNPSLKPVADHLDKLGYPVTFIPDMRKAFEIIQSAESGVFLLENLRHNDGEKANDQKFAKELASLGDIYVNDAFSAAHREHASIVGVPGFITGFAGLQLENEVSHLSKAFSPSHPFLFILGGAKFETKLPLIKRFGDIADSIFIGGALANDALKVLGREVGISKVSNGTFKIRDVVSKPNVLLPVDAVVQNHEEKDIEYVSKKDKILDAGPKTCKLLKKHVDEAKFILWNGPLGLYEDGYQGATLELAKMIGARTSHGTETIVGGGDTQAAISSLGIGDKFSFISTGGGAMLDFLAKGTLPGIEALKIVID